MSQSKLRVKISIEKQYKQPPSSSSECFLRDEENIRLQIYADTIAKQIEEKLNSLDAMEFELIRANTSWLNDMKRLGKL